MKIETEMACIGAHVEVPERSIERTVPSDP
jgi:hypothetical protein